MKEHAGALVRAARELRERTGDELARAVGIDAASLSRLEQGKVTHPPPPDVLALIHREIGLSPLSFLRAWGYNLGESPVIADVRLQEIIDVWSNLHPKIQSSMRNLLELPGAVESEEPRVAAVAR